MYLDFALNSPTIWVFFAVVLFLLVLAYFGIHKKIGGALDARADKIRAELDEAKSLREEAQALLASYQRKQKEAEDKATTKLESKKVLEIKKRRESAIKAERAVISQQIKQANINDSIAKARKKEAQNKTTPVSPPEAFSYIKFDQII